MPAKIERINLGFVNCYLIKTDGGFILVDTGIGALRERLARSLDAAGCGGKNLKLIILTHGDIDHSGNCAFLGEKYGAPVAMHAGDSAMVETGDMNADRKVNSRFMRFMQAIMKLTGAAAKMARDFEKFTPDILLADGQRLDAYGLDAKVMHIPGHTDGSIAVLLDSGECLCGDTMQNNRSAIIVKHEGDLRRSLDKLSALNLKTVYPGHGKPFAWKGLGA